VVQRASLTTLSLFGSLQIIYINLRSPHSSRKFLYFETGYYILAIISASLLFICYCFTAKIDAIVWSIVLIAVLLVNIFTLTLRKGVTISENIKLSDNVNLKYSEDETSITEPKDKKEARKFGETCLKILDIVLKILFLVFLALLVNASIVIGPFTIRYPARGKFVQVPLDDFSGRSLRIHFKCDGPKNDTLPVFMFEGSSSHGMADYFGLQLLLKEKNRRSCIWDKAGLGYSDSLYSDMRDHKLYYHNFISSLGEKEPFVFVGWGGGGETIYEYATLHPEMVHSLAFLDVAPFQAEWKVPQMIKNWTQSEFDATVKRDLASRMVLINVINGIAVPFGLMAVFIPPEKSYPDYLRDERRWYFLTDKTWVTQAHFLKQMASDRDVFQAKLPANISVSHFLTVKSDAQIEKEICRPRNLNVDDCNYEKKAFGMMTEMKMALVPNQTIVKCNEDACNLGYYVYDGPQFTVDNLISLYS